MRLHVSGQSRPTSLREWPADQGQRHLHSVTWDTALSCHVELLTGDLLRLLWTYNGLNARKSLLRPCKACLTPQGGRCTFSAGGGEKRGPSTRWKCCAHMPPRGDGGPSSRQQPSPHPAAQQQGPQAFALTWAHRSHLGSSPSHGLDPCLRGCPFPRDPPSGLGLESLGLGGQAHVGPALLRTVARLPPAPTLGLVPQAA